MYPATVTKCLFLILSEIWKGRTDSTPWLER